jgi:hypothetical protein
LKKSDIPFAPTLYLPSFGRKTTVVKLFGKIIALLYRFRWRISILGDVSGGIKPKSKIAGNLTDEDFSMSLTPTLYLLALEETW